MKILVLIKQVPDRDARLVLDESRRGLVETDLSWEINESDRYAIETGLRIKESLGESGGDGEVVVCTIGPDRARKAISSALAMGCDRGVHLCDEDFLGADPLAMARALAAVAQQEDYPLILSGTRSDDAGYGETSLLLAGLLGRPAVFLTVGVELIDTSRVRVVRELERSRQEIAEVTLPAVLAVQSGIHEVRYTSLKGIMAAKRKPVATPTAESLGLSVEQIGRSGSRLEVLELAPPQKKGQCEFLDGEPAAVARDLVAKLQREAKVL
ncbi:MAG: electron transfer flavoprotein subunit beta/FixA family protein [Acidobacteriota bacterium]|nr:MAG: electron transfer flavoprotein subunit beta/FixA family protein [Acidobacteriota bacterium]